MPLFTYASHIDPRQVRADTLVVTLGGFLDAGHTQRLVDHQVLDGLASHRVGSFDADVLVDHRAERPGITFAGDRFTDYDPPALVLLEATDRNDTPFLLLQGPEPDFRWEELAATVERLVDDHEVRTTVFVQGIPMSTPHTRPVQVTRWASRPELIPGNRPLVGTIRMRASFPSMLALRLGDAGHDVIGLVAHVPHYLAPGDYPDSALAVIDALQQSTGVSLPTSPLELVRSAVRAEIDEQVASSEETREMVTELEHQYDRFMAEHRLEARPEPADLPSAEEIAAEAEKFLRSLDEPPSGDEPPAQS